MHDSEQEHSGITGCRVTYESTIFYNEANKFSIIVVKTNDPRIPLQACSGRYYGDRMLRFTAVGYELPRTKAVELELDGEWVESKYGYQLQVEQWQEIVPQTADGLLAYLGSGLIKGIGPETAEDIVATFGPDTLNQYGYAVVSLLKGETDYGKMTIGSVARCVCCGGEQKNHRSIRCAECGNMYVCKSCGKTVHGYGRYINEHFYCNECSYECTVYKEKFIGMPRIGIAQSGEQRGICPACYEQVIGVCRNCTIHSDCLSIGANRFCPNQMNGLAA